MNLKQQIIKLSEQNKSLTEIAKELNCSKSTVCYHLNPSQKDKMLNRQRRRRSSIHPFCSKFEEFSRPHRSLYYKVHNFQKTNMNKQQNFSVQDVIDKFGEDTTCYLTGEPINIYNTKSYEFDHKIPKSRGGDNSLENLGICTTRVNQAKKDLTIEEFISMCKSVAKYSG